MTSRELRRRVGAHSRAVLTLGLGAVLVGCSAGQLSPSPLPPSARPLLGPTPGFAVVPAGPFPTELTAGLRTEVDVPFTAEVACGSGTCAVPLDVLAPTEASGLPTMVLVPGGPTRFEERRYMEDLAAGLAREGAVVFLVGYRSSASGNGAADMRNDIRCAIRFARETTADYGGDPQAVSLIGHSVGSEVALGMAVAQWEEPSGCLAAGEGTPDGVVGLAGFHFDIPDDASPGPRLRLGAASDDQYSTGGESAAADLASIGFAVEFREFPDTGHGDLVDPATPGLIHYLFWR